MSASAPIWIGNAEIDGVAGQHMLIADGCIARIGPDVPAPPDAQTIDAAGAALLPGLNDHHLHLASLAAARGSLSCGPPNVHTEFALAETLRERAAGSHTVDWIRGVGYHESVAGGIDAAWLDAHVANCPVRIQHRGGRLWIFNSRALERLAPDASAPLERRNGRLTGRLVEGDAWLRTRLHSGFPDLRAVGAELAGYGITGVTDTTPQNNRDTLAQFAAARANGELPQSLLMMGNASLDRCAGDAGGGIAVGAHKFHLLESRLPDLDQVTAAIARSHDVGRNAAFHCVTRTELVFALAALRAAGPLAGDRIEHASVAPPELLEQIQQLGVTVVSQPAFVFERGDQYLRRVDSEDQPGLYSFRNVLDAGIALAGSSDAPFAGANPWPAMQAAVSRRTRDGAQLGPAQALTPEQALALYTSPLSRPGQARGPLQVGDAADLCLLRQPWQVARADLSAVRVRATVISGRLIHSSPSG